MLRPDQRYDGNIALAGWMESKQGTPGLSLSIETDDGNEITHVLWFSEKARPYSEKTIKEFGVTEANLKSGAFMEHELPSFLVGQGVTFGTKEEVREWQGETKREVKLSWIGTKRAPSDPRGIGYAVAALFGGETESKETAAVKAEFPDDSDIPF